MTLFSEKEKEEQVASISNMLAALKDNTVLKCNMQTLGGTLLRRTRRVCEIKFEKRGPMATYSSNLQDHIRILITRSKQNGKYIGLHGSEYSFSIKSSSTFRYHQEL